MGLDHPHTKAGVGEFGVAISGGVWVAIRAAVDVSDPVDLRLQASLGELVDQPVARCNVLGGQGRSVDASFVLADASQFVKVTEEPIGGNLLLASAGLV